MKINIQKWTRVIPCLTAVCLVILASVLPAHAATFTGDWTFNQNITPPAWTSVTINFTTNGVTYTEMEYVAYSEAYEVPLITFKSESGNRPAIYWRNGVTYFTDPQFRYITFTGFQWDMDSVFTNWMLSSAQQGRVTADSEAAGSAKDEVDSALDGLGNVSNELDKLPQPDINADSFLPSELEGQAYLNLVNTLKVFWSNSTLLTMTSILSGLILLSYVLFAGKA